MMISIHAPRAGSDTDAMCSELPLRLFQSTLPVRGATSLYLTSVIATLFQSTLPVRGATATSLAVPPNR